MTKGGLFVENTLRRIVDADRASRLSVEKARERRENLSEELSRRKKEIDAAHKKNAEDAVKKAREKAELKVNRASLELDGQTKQKSDALKKIYDENHNMWVENIVKAVIG